MLNAPRPRRTASTSRAGGPPPHAGPLHRPRAALRPRGACAGCWCMWWRVPRATGRRGRGGEPPRPRGVRARRERGRAPRVRRRGSRRLDRREPRAAYPRLARSRSLAPVDERPVWSITCFFVARSHRGRGVTRARRGGGRARARARRAGARGVPGGLARRLADAFLYTGAASTFEALGFEEVARRSPTRRLVRLELSGPRAPAARARARGRSTGRSSPTPSSGARRGR